MRIARGLHNLTPKTQDLTFYLYGLVATWLLALSSFYFVFDFLDLEVSYASHPVLFSLYYLFFLALTFVLYQRNLQEVYKRVSSSTWIQAGVFTLGVFVYFFVLQFVVEQQNMPPGDLFGSAQFLHAGFTYAVPKFFEIVLQQQFIVLFAIACLHLTRNVVKATALYAFGFGVAHAPLVLYLSTDLALMFVAASVMAGIIFPLVLFAVRGGIVYTYMVHWMFYVVISAYMLLVL